MDVDSFRRAKEWTLEDLARQLEVGSKGYLSDLLRGRQTWPLELALRMQRLSDGQVLARDLIPPEKRELLDQLTSAPASMPA